MIHTEIATFVLVSIGIYITIAYWTRTARIEDFYVAGRSIKPHVSGAATAAAWMSAASFISMAGVIAILGYDAVPFLIGWTGGYVLLALLIAPYLRKYGKYTIPEFVEDRYYDPKMRLLGVIIVIMIAFIYSLGQFIGIGIALSMTLGIPVVMGIWLTVIVIMIYTTLGGMKSVTYVEVAQYTILIVAYLVALFTASFFLKGYLFPHVQAGELLNEIVNKEAQFGERTMVDPFVNKVAGGQGVLNWVFTALILMIGTVGMPHIMVKYYLVPSARDARYSVGWALIFIALLYLSASVYAIVGRYLIINQLLGTSVDQAQQITWVKTMKELGMLKLKDLNGNGILDSLAEIGIRKDAIVMGMPMMANLPWFIIALVITGGFAAALSTSGALLLTMTVSLTRDIYKRFINPEASEAREVWIARVATVIIASTVAFLASLLYEQGGVIAIIVGWAYSVSVASLVPLFVLGIWTRVGKKAMIVGAIVGLAVCYTYLLGNFFKVIPPILGLGQIAGGGIFGGIACFVTALIVQAITKEEPPGHVVALLDRLKLPEKPRRI